LAGYVSNAVCPQERHVGHVAIVTGAAQGIGKAITQELIFDGATVIATDIDGQLLAELPEQTIAAQRCIGIQADVTDQESLQSACQTVLDRFGRIDILVNNAGVAAYFDAASMTEEQWDSVFAVDLKGVWLASKCVLPTMRDQRSGSIVNIASIHARLTVAGMFPYAAAKSAVIGLTRSLALDSAAYGIRVNAVSPGWTSTALVEEWFDRQDDPIEARRSVNTAHPLGRICEPREIASVVSFIASQEASAITGAEIAVDAGLSARFAT
jgi:NAD(P)-dependent dehydrogenase (short-subunit alcohol dehydrogenase family)